MEVRLYEVYFVTTELGKCLVAGEILAEVVGKLVTMRGIVIRCSEVMPHVNVVTYLCDTCGCEVYQEVNGPQYTPTQECPSKDCQESSANGRLELQLRGLSFSKYQEIRVQETSDQVPIGSIPRAMTVKVSGKNTRLCQPVNVWKLLMLRNGFQHYYQHHYQALILLNLHHQMQIRCGGSLVAFLSGLDKFLLIIFAHDTLFVHFYCKFFYCKFLLYVIFCIFNKFVILYLMCMWERGKRGLQKV